MATEQQTKDFVATVEDLQDKLAMVKTLPPHLQETLDPELQSLVKKLNELFEEMES